MDTKISEEARAELLHQPLKNAVDSLPEERFSNPERTEFPGRPTEVQIPISTPGQEGGAVLHADLKAKPNEFVKLEGTGEEATHAHESIVTQLEKPLENFNLDEIGKTYALLATLDSPDQAPTEQLK